MEIVRSEPNWRSRCLDVLDILLDVGGMDTASVALGHKIVSDLRNENLPPVFVPPFTGLEAFGGITECPAPSEDRSGLRISDFLSTCEREGIDDLKESAAPDPGEIGVEPEEKEKKQESATPSMRPAAWTPERRAAQSAIMAAARAAKAKKNGTAAGISVTNGKEAPSVKAGDTILLSKPDLPAAVPSHGNSKVSAIAECRERYRKYMDKGGVISNAYEGVLIADFGLTRTEVMAIRDELLKLRSPRATAAANKASNEYDGTKETDHDSM